MSNDAYNKVFRAEKTTKNRDDFKVLMVGLMLGIFLILLLPVATRWYDTAFIDRPFVKATVEIIQTEDHDKPMILYDADAVKSVKASWTATIRNQKGVRLGSRRGYGNYSDVLDNPRLWTWAAFFDSEDGVPPPAIPLTPFKICVRYTAVTLDTEISDESPEYCSLVFHPEFKTAIIEEAL